MIRIRIDDFPQTKGEPQHTLAAFREFHRELAGCIGGKRYLLGVIPGRCTPEDLLFLRNETDCVVGMHGTDHDEARLDRNGGNQFEPFMTVQVIKQSLYDHHTALQGAIARPVQVYMPPRNVIDARTVEALATSPMTRITAGPETDPKLMSSKFGGRWLMSRPPHEYGRTDEMWNRASHRILSADPFDTILTLHWTWETNIGLFHMTKFLTSIPADRFVDFDA